MNRQPTAAIAVARLQNRPLPQAHELRGKAPTLKSHVCRYLREHGESYDLDVYKALAPVASARRIESAIFALRESGRVLAARAGTLLRLAP